jgi:spermidine synthase
MNQWFNEELDEQYFDLGARVSIQIGETLFEGQSDFQKLQIVKTPKFGNMMILDGAVMLTEANEFAYHEMIAHIPLFAHPNPKRVLIIGGGDGGAAREVLRHACVEECVMVEIDGLVVEKSREFFPTIACELDNPRLTLLIDDGIKYIENAENEFDVILVDSTDPAGPAEGLFTADFYQKVFKALKADGLMAAQAESPYYFKKTQKELFGVLDSIFPYTSMYISAIPFYPSGTWSFAFASKDYSEISHARVVDLEKMSPELQYVNPSLFRGCFALPTFMRKNIA